MQFIVSWAREVPLKVPVTLRIHVAYPPDADTPAAVQDAVHNCFTNRAVHARREFLHLMWSPMQTYLYDWWPTQRQIRNLPRLSTMPVETARAPMTPPPHHRARSPGAAGTLRPLASRGFSVQLDGYGAHSRN